MDPFCDNFISYENLASPSFEAFADPNFSFTSPYSDSPDSFSHFPDFFPKTIQNILDPEVLAQKDSMQTRNSPATKKSKPFQIIKPQKCEPVPVVEPEVRLDYTDQPTPVYSADIDTESENKLSNRSKRIAKVAKAKGRASPTQTPEEFLNNVDFRLIPEGFGDPAIDHKTQKKMMKMIKNRVSAQNSRDKKKVQMQELEDAKTAYADENRMLHEEKNLLLEKLEKLEADYALLLKENEAMRNNALNMNYQCGSNNTINANLQCGSNGLNMNYQCGSTAESEPTTPSTPTNVNTDAATEDEDHSSPTSTSNSSNGGGFSIMSVALAALLCFLFIITGGHVGEFPASVLQNIKTPTIFRLSKTFLTEFAMGPLKKLEELPRYTEEFETLLRDFNFGELPIFDKVKPLMEQFEKFHQTVTGDNVEMMPTAEAFSRISTLFVPAGFEMSKSVPKMEVEVENRGELQLNTEEYKGLDTKTRQLDIEKADYIQLLVPKFTVGKLNVAENSNEIKRAHDCGQYNDENSLVEVWCKVIARRNTAISL